MNSSEIEIEMEIEIEREKEETTRASFHTRVVLGEKGEREARSGVNEKIITTTFGTTNSARAHTLFARPCTKGRNYARLFFTPRVTARGG